ncbi:hypothetical protein BDF22DRAFT_674642 [Syncephalis plumigaleata]|nr:hypothetical protein BDF22DRAFT_674642 [Syncephalis plumigaleata]
MLPKLKEHDKDDNDAAAADHHYENEEVNTATHESSSIRADIEVKTRSISALTNNTTTTTTTTTSETSLPSTTLPNGLGHRKSRSKFLPWRLPLVGTTNRTGEEPVRHYTASRVIIRCRNSPEVSVYALAEARRHQAECFYKAVSVNSNFNGSSSDAAQASNSQHPLDGQWRSVPSNIAPLLANNNNTSRNHNKQPQQHHAVQNRPSIAAKPIDSSDIIETVATPTSTAASLTRNNGVVPIETIRSGFSHAISAPLDISVHTRSPMNSIQLSGKDPVAIPCSMVKVITSPRVVYRSLQRVERTIELLQQTLTRHRVPHSTSSDGKRVAVAWRPSIDELQHDRLLRKHSCVASLQIWRSASGINAIAMKRIGGSRSRYTCMRSWLSRALRAQQRDKHRNNCCSDMFTGDTGD